MRLPLLLGAALFLAACGASAGGGSGTPPIDASTLPLIGAPRRLGVVYSAPDPAARATLDAAFGETIAAGADSYELSIAWAALEPRPGEVDVAGLVALLDTVRGAGLRPYLVIKTIDTVRLAVPADLVDPRDPAAFAAGRGFADAGLRARFDAVLDAVVPALVARGGFALSVANEIDPWLAAHPGERGAFLGFLAGARDRAHARDPRLAVGATCGSGALASDPALLPAVLARSDAAFFTYYPLTADFRVRDPSVVAGDVEAMVAAADGKPVLLQEVGYPAGYATPGDGSSEAKQAAFVRAVFAALAAQPRIRYVSFMQLADWTPAEVAGFTAYYGFSDPRFVEYLATLGLIHADGARRPAFQALLDGLRGTGVPTGSG